MPSIDPEKYRPLGAAVDELAKRCDGARRDDGQGFNGVDASFGKQMSALPVRLWTLSQAESVYEMLEKYQGQLSAYGIDFDEVPDPREDEDLQARAEAEEPGRMDDGVERLIEPVEVHGEVEEFVVQFGYNEELVAAVKEIPGRRWEPNRKEWRVPVGQESIEALKDFAEEHDFRAPFEWPEGEAMRRLELENETVARFVFPYDEDVLEAVKSLDGARWNGDDKYWTVPLTAEGRRAIEVAEAWGFEIDPDVEEALSDLQARREKNLATSDAAEADYEVEGLNPELEPYPFQRAGIAYAVRNRRVMIADEMGLGKTVQSIASVRELDAFPAVFVVPASLKLNWAKELAWWLPELRGQISIAEGTDMAPAEPEIVRLPGGEQVEIAVNDYSAQALVVNYDLFSIDLSVKKDSSGDVQEYLFGPILEAVADRGNEAIVLDESHYVKSHDALRTHACRKLAQEIPNRFLLTGTPFVNRPKELISQLRILGRLEEFGGWWGFAQQYCGAHQTNFGLDISGATNLEELNERLRATCYVRRKKTDVLSELPDKTRSEVSLQITNREDYLRAKREFLEWVRQQAKKEAAMQAELDGLSEEERTERVREASWEKVRRARRAEQLRKIGELKQLVARGKLEPAIEWVENFLDSGEKLVLFAVHAEILEALQEAFPGAARIVSEDSPSERQANVERFQEDEDCRLVIAALGTSATASPGGVGHTLTAASNVAFLELGWSPAQHDQATDRCHRIGQEDSVTAWYLLAPNTVDETIAGIIREKRANLEVATDGSGAGVSKKSVAGEIVSAISDESLEWESA